MPNISTFQTPQLDIRPSEIGVEATAAAARRIGMFGNQIAASKIQTGEQLGSDVKDVGQIAENYFTHKEVSQGSKDGSQLALDATTEWNNRAKQIVDNDPNAIAQAAQKFREEWLEPRLDQFSTGFSTERGQQWADSFANQMRQHMVTSTQADVARISGYALQHNAVETVNNLGVMVNQDPSSLDFALKAIEHKIGGMADTLSGLTADQAAEAKMKVIQESQQNLVKSAVSSMIEKNPSIDLGAVEKKYGDYLKPGEMEMFQKAAQRQAKSDAAMARADALQKRQLADLNVHQGANKVVADNVTIDENTGRPIVNPRIFKQNLDLLKANPDAPNAASTFKAMNDWAESQLNRETKPVDDSTALKELSDRMFSPDNPTTTLDLMKAHAAGKLSDHTFAALNGLVKEMEQTPLKGPIYQDTMKAVHDQLVVNVPGIPGKDTVGTSNYAKFVQTFVPQYLAKFRSGTLEPNALDVKDPNSMISQTMAPFIRSPQQRMKDYLSSLEGMDKTPQAEPKRVATKADYDALPVGTIYISAKDGQRYEKR